MKKHRSEKLKDVLDSVLNVIQMNKDQYVTNPDKDFTRKRKLTFTPGKDIIYPSQVFFAFVPAGPVQVQSFLKILYC